MHSVQKEGELKVLKPMFAFKGIETTIFTGLWPNIHGVWTELVFADDGNSNLNRLSRTIIRISDIIGNDKIRKMARIAPEIVFRGTKSRLTPNVIPVEALNFFRPAMKKAIHEQGAIDSIPTLFDILRVNNMKFRFIEPPYFGGDKGVLTRTKSLSSQDSTNLWYLKLNRLDKEGHLNGPFPEKFRKSILSMDSTVEQIINAFNCIADELNVIIFADHGMSSVINYLDVLGLLRKLPFRIYKDYIVFVDSTVVRFWFHNKETRREIVQYLSTIPEGHVLTEEERAKLRIPRDRYHGEIIFALNEGCVAYPDFWSGARIVSGMHGFAYSKQASSSAACIVNGNMKSHFPVEDQIEYTQLFPSILSSLRIESDQYHLNAGRSADIR